MREGPHSNGTRFLSAHSAPGAQQAQYWHQRVGLDDTSTNEDIFLCRDASTVDDTSLLAILRGHRNQCVHRATPELADLAGLLPRLVDRLTQRACKESCEYATPREPQSLAGGASVLFSAQRGSSSSKSMCIRLHRPWP